MTRYPTRPGAPTENGWAMLAPTAVARYDVPGGKSSPVPLQPGPAGALLARFAYEYHRRIEPIASQVWGYSADNDVANSNHMSGTAIDINAPQYPWQRYTMPAARVRAVTALVATFDGTILWGRVWQRPDEMHYQVNTRDTDRIRAVLAWRADPLPTPPPGDGRTLRQGSSGPAVGALQARLNRDYPRYSALAVDGVFGPATAAVVAEFQARAGLTVDSIAGPATLEKLGML